MERHITLPLTEEIARSLRAGDSVYLTGEIYTSRDAGHKRMCEALERGEDLPFDPKDATIYYVGPTPAKPGQVIGSAGPTTSGRMDAYAPTMMSVGARGMIGKGARLPEPFKFSPFTLVLNYLWRQFLRIHLEQHFQHCTHHFPDLSEYVVILKHSVNSFQYL